MSKTGLAEVNCFCGETNHVKVVKPGPTEIKVTKFHCSVCKSKLMVRVGRIAGNNKQLNHETLLLEATPKLRDILVERKKAVN